MTNKIKNLEFLRIIGCLAIIGVHLFTSSEGFLGILPNYSMFIKAHNMTAHGYIAVDLFFILSGLFFALKLDITQSLWQFLKKKLIRLYPVLVCMLFIGWLGSVFGLYKISIYDSILSLCCLNGTGFVDNHGGFPTGGGQFWYVSAMLFVLSFFYYILKNYDKKNTNIILALLIYCVYTFAVGHHNLVNSVKYLGIFFSAGMCRAIGGIGIGYFIAQWYKLNINTIKNQNLNFWQTLFFTVIEFMCIFFIINNLMFHKIKFDNDFIFILVFTITIILFLYNKGFISRLLNLDIFPFLAKYTYSIYMVHCWLIYNLNHSFWCNHKHFVITHPIANIIFAYAIFIICGVLMYHFVEKPASKYLKENWK